MYPGPWLVAFLVELWKLFSVVWYLLNSVIFWAEESNKALLLFWSYKF